MVTVYIASSIAAEGGEPAVTLGQAGRSLCGGLFSSQHVCLLRSSSKVPQSTASKCFFFVASLKIKPMAKECAIFFSMRKTKGLKVILTENLIKSLAGGRCYSACFCLFSIKVEQIFVIPKQLCLSIPYCSHIALPAFILEWLYQMEPAGVTKHQTSSTHLCRWKKKKNAIILGWIIHRVTAWECWDRPGRSDPVWAPRGDASRSPTKLPRNRDPCPWYRGERAEKKIHIEFWLSHNRREKRHQWEAVLAADIWWCLSVRVGSSNNRHTSKFRFKASGYYKPRGWRKKIK